MLSPMRLLFTALLACACGAGRETESSVCELPEVAAVSSEFTVDCLALRHNVLIARKTLLDNGVMPADELDVVLSKTHLHLHDRWCLNDNPEKSNSCHAGRTYVGSGDVELTRTTFGLAHELIHRWEGDHAPVGSVAKSVINDHWGWPLRYYTAQMQYEEQMNVRLPLE
jgi:hypothetical protein